MNDMVDQPARHGAHPERRDPAAAWSGSRSKRSSAAPSSAAQRRAGPARAERAHRPPDVPLVECDAVLIERVLANLLENAGKYTPAGRRWRSLRAPRGRRAAGQRARPRPGPAARARRRRSSRSSRAANAESATPGVGLGLAICRAIVEAHRGRIWVEPTPAAAARRFTFTPAAGHAAGDRPGRRRTERHIETRRPDDRHRTPIALVLEDEPQIRRFVRAALEAEGWQVFEAGTVKQGLVEAGTRRPDLVIARPRPARRRRRRLHPRRARLVARADHRAVGAHRRGRQGRRARRRRRRLPHQAVRRRRAAGAHARRPAPACAAGARSADAVFRFGDVEVDLAARIVRKARRRGAPDADRVPAARRADRQRRPGADPPPAAARGVGPDAMSRAPTTCASTWATCARSSRTIRRSRGTSSPRPAWATGC